MVYDDRIIAYLDILGFHEKIKETERESLETGGESKTLEFLISSLSYLQGEIRAAIENLELPPGTIATMFSDTIVVSIPKAQSVGVLHLFAILKGLQIKSTHENIFLRGCITFGKLYHTEEVIIGPALINAYKVEISAAVYPRIVIDPKVMDLYVRGYDERNGDYKIKDYDYHLTFEDDFDGTSYIDYFNDIVNYVIVDPELYFAKLNNAIEKVLKDGDPSLRMKYMWMQQKIKSANYLDDVKYSNRPLSE